MTNQYKPGDKLEVNVGTEAYPSWKGTLEKDVRIYIGTTSTGRVVYEIAGGYVDSLPAAQVHKLQVEKKAWGLKKKWHHLITQYKSEAEAISVRNSLPFPNEWVVVEISWKE